MYRLDGVRMRGVASRVPARVVKTADYEVMTPQERQRFAKMVGVHERRIASEAQCASDLCAFAVDDLLAGLDWEADSIGLMILVTQSGDYPIPATSIILQNKLGLGRHCICLDINLGCSGYPFGIAVVAGLMRSLSIKRALLLTGDISSKVCAYTDKTSWPVFGDAGAATAFELDDTAPPCYFELLNDGAGNDAIIIPAGGLGGRVALDAARLQPVQVEEGVVRHAANLVLKGAEIFSFALREVPPSILSLLASTQTDPKAIDLYVFHQANKLITDTIRAKIGAAPERCISSIEQFGNTSSASIPLTLCVHKDKLATGALTMLSGFGVGLSWGNAIVSIAPGSFFSLVETDAVYGA